MIGLVGFETPRFPDTDTQAAEVTKWRSSYTELLRVLGSLGTEVRRKRVLETDQDIQPTFFVRGATHEFIFPPQETEVIENKSGVVDPTPGYTLHEEDVTRVFDETLVEGHVRVSYDDADSKISFHITDMKENSQIPDDALVAFEALSSGVETVRNSTS